MPRTGLVRRGYEDDQGADLPIHDWTYDIDDDRKDGNYYSTKNYHFDPKLPEESDPEESESESKIDLARWNKHIFNWPQGHEGGYAPHQERGTNFDGDIWDARLDDEGSPIDSTTQCFAGMSPWTT